jgi:hypothetical protein
MKHGWNTEKEAFASPFSQGALLRDPGRKAPVIFVGVASEPRIANINREQGVYRVPALHQRAML